MNFDFLYNFTKFFPLLAYTYLTLNFFLGGYVGLLLGASAVKLANINGFLLDFCFGKEKSNKILDLTQNTIIVKETSTTNVQCVNLVSSKKDMKKY